ncbi:MAG: alpha/beta hydrolase, partial [Acutalibacteraceae bacterium]
MQIFLSVILTLAAVIVIFIIADFVIFKTTFGRVKSIKKIEEKFYNNLSENSNKKYAQKIKSGKDKIIKLDYEEVEIMSYDEFSLSGKLYLSDGAGDKTVLLCHGYKSCGEFDFSQVFFEYRKLGFNILMIDQRAHAKSGGYCSLGVNESFDVLSWCRWLEMRFGTGCPITLHGVSMGAFSVLAASANSNLPKNVVRVVAESAYDSAVTVFTTSALRALGFLGKIFVAPVNMMCRFFAGFDMRDLSLVRLAPR